MKKASLFLFFYCICVITAIGQTKAEKDSLMKVMARQVCEELKDKDFTNSKKEDIEMAMGLAAIPVFAEHADALNKIYGIDFNDEKEVEEFGRNLGVSLATQCPAFMRALAKSDSFGEVIGITPEKPATLTLSGTLQKIMPDEITHFVVKDISGKIEKIWWFGYFEGSEMVNSGNINKPVTIDYTEMEIYNAAIKSYIKMKVAKKISVR